jgi:antitoxin ParD1/3/4
MRATMNISLPESMKQWVEQQAARRGYGTVSEYFRSLLREEQERLLRQQVEENLHAALNSGESTPMTPSDWKRLRREGRKRLARKS